MIWLTLPDGITGTADSRKKEVRYYMIGSWCLWGLSSFESWALGAWLTSKASCEVRAEGGRGSPALTLIELNEMLKERVSAHQILSAVAQYWESYRPDTYPILPVK